MRNYYLVTHLFILKVYTSQCTPNTNADDMADRERKSSQVQCITNYVNTITYLSF